MHTYVPYMLSIQIHIDNIQISSTCIATQRAPVVPRKSEARGREAEKEPRGSAAELWGAPTIVVILILIILTYSYSYSHSQYSYYFSFVVFVLFLVFFFLVFFFFFFFFFFVFSFFFFLFLFWWLLVCSRCRVVVPLCVCVSERDLSEQQDRLFGVLPGVRVSLGIQIA